MSARYLQPGEKLDEGRRFAEVFHSSTHFTDDGEGGRGFPDREMLEVCCVLNSFDGICTVQSCAGHRIESAPPDGEPHVYSGQLWLRLSEPVARLFYTHAPTLGARRDLIERVSLLWLDGEREVADIVFKGMNEGPVFFDRSVALIIGFFESLVADW